MKTSALIILYKQWKGHIFVFCYQYFSCNIIFWSNAKSDFGVIKDVGEIWLQCNLLLIEKKLIFFIRSTHYFVSNNWYSRIKVLKEIMVLCLLIESSSHDVKSQINAYKMKTSRSYLWRKVRLTVISKIILYSRKFIIYSLSGTIPMKFVFVT